jgi:hypothetical protein
MLSMTRQLAGQWMRGPHWLQCQQVQTCHSENQDKLAGCRGTAGVAQELCRGMSIALVGAAADVPTCRSSSSQGSHRRTEVHSTITAEVMQRGPTGVRLLAVSEWNRV